MSAIPSPTERLVTASELAGYLGLSTATVLDWWEAGRLPGFKLNGRAVRFRPSEVEAWLEAQRRGPSLASRPEAVV
jgi:excisionase family DNA binding protein